MDERRVALGFVGAAAAPLLLHTWWAQGEVGDDTLRSLLPSVWKDVEFPMRSLKRAQWLELFEAADFVSEPAALERPAEALEVYRGANPTHARGLAWTRDRERAAAFAEAWPAAGARPAAVYKVEAPPEAVLAIIHVGKTQDVVVHPSRIPKLSRL
jgi:hypothetical protein